MKRLLVFLSCLTLLSAVAAQTRASKPPINCTVQGQIVQQPGGLPIRKADITLFRIGEEEQDEAEYAAVTDPEGRFKFEDVKPGNYRLEFEHSGFLDAEKRHHGSGMLLSLEPAQEVKDLLFHMTPAGVIIGKVTDNEGDPVPRVDVAAIPYGGTRRSASQIVGDVTNDMGEYRIGGLPPNRYLVIAQPLSQLTRAVELAKKGDKNVATYAITYYPGTTDRSQAVPLALRPGDETPANIALSLVRTLHVRGEVTNLPRGDEQRGQCHLAPPG
jgi:5-hydroxyisourate hydrolase-like protein (transthyretin family)